MTNVIKTATGITLYESDTESIKEYIEEAVSWN
jgi:hypothetical protein